jgi:histidine triad (HIT) family protein
MTETDNMTPEQVAELQKQNCIFCKIISREIPAKILHETDKVICILDINPASEGHLIIFPKQHYMIIPHIPQEVNSEMFRVVKLMSKTLLKTLQCKGTTIFIANGMAAGQKAPHVLVHLFPRREGDGLLHFESKEFNEENMKQLSASLKPYVAQILGDKPEKTRNPFIEKDDKNEEQEDTEEHNNKEEYEENSEVEENEEKSDSEESDVKSSEQKKHKKKKSVKNKDKTSSNISSTKENAQKKVNLDEISKLFG